ncbi:MAG TPA: hypothetical protein VN802_21805 [Stellaceae bacterium]|nr:hypothetical protein [Stellaceae bacterium]
MPKKSVHCCSICGEPPITSRIIDDGAVIWHCHDHLEAHEREIFDELLDDGWEAPPPRTIH